MKKKFNQENAMSYYFLSKNNRLKKKNTNIQCCQKLVKEEELKFLHTIGESIANFQWGYLLISINSFK